MKRLTTVLLLIVFTATAFAVTVDQVMESPMTKVGKFDILVLLNSNEIDKADEKFSKAVETIEKKKLTSMIKQLKEELKAEEAAKLKAEQAKIIWDLTRVISPLKIEDVWPIASAVVDTVQNPQFLIEFLVKRYKLDYGVYTDLLSVQKAYEERSAERKFKAEIWARTKTIVSDGDEKLAEWTQTLASELDSLGLRVTSLENDLASVVKLQRKYSDTFEEFKASIINGNKKRRQNQSEDW